MPSIARVLHQGLAADKPTADAELNQGWIYYETDTDQLVQSWGGAWVMINAGGGVSGLARIDTQTVGVGGALNVEFTGIPDTYSTLYLVGVARGDHAAAYIDINGQLNGDAGANYDWQDFYSYPGGQGGDAVTSLDTKFLVGLVPGSTAPANEAHIVQIWIPFYASTTFYKEILTYTAGPSSSNAVPSGTVQDPAAWRNTAAVTAIKLFPSADKFVEGTQFALYGFV